MHVLTAAPRFIDRPEVGGLTGALDDPGVRVISVVGAAGNGKTSLVQEVLRSGSYEAFVWRYDLHPDVHDLMEAINRRFGTDLVGPSGLGEVAKPILLVIDGVDGEVLQRQGRMPAVHGLEAFVRGCLTGGGAARVVLTVREPWGVASGVGHRRVEVGWLGKEACEAWLREEGLGQAQRPMDALGPYVGGARSFDRLRAALAAGVALGEGARPADKDQHLSGGWVLPAVLAREPELVREVAFGLAGVGLPLKAHQVAPLLMDPEADGIAAALERLVSLRVADRGGAAEDPRYEVEPCAARALQASDDELLGMYRVYLNMKVHARTDEGCLDPVAVTPDSDVFADLATYAMDRGRGLRVVPAPAAAGLAEVLVQHWGVRLEHAMFGQRPWFDRAVTQILTGAPARAEAGLRALRATLEPSARSGPRGGLEPGRSIAIAEALVDAMTAQGKLRDAAALAADVIEANSDVADELVELLARRANIRSLLGEVDRADEDFAQSFAARNPRRGLSVPHVLRARHLVRLGRLKGARDILQRRPAAPAVAALAAVVQADLHRASGGLETAAEALRGAQDLAETQGDQPLIMEAAIAASRLAARRKDEPGARAQAHDAAAIARVGGYWVHLVDALNCVARSPDPEVDLDEALQLARDTGYVWGLTATLQLAAERALERRQPGRAVELATEALRLREQTRDPKRANTVRTLRAAEAARLEL